MGEIQKTYNIEFKREAVAMFRIGYKTVATALGIDNRMVRRWMAHYEREGIEGFREKRGTSGGFEEWETKEGQNLGGKSAVAASENALQKSYGNCKGARSKRRQTYQAIEALTSNYPVVLLCELAGIARSSYYKWAARKNNSTPNRSKNRL